MITGVSDECFIVALFIRDDGKRFVLGQGLYEFNKSQLHFAGNNLASDILEIQGSDGSLLAGQVERASDQDFKGYINTFGVSKEAIEKARREFIAFFEKGRLFTVVYVLPSGQAIKRQRGYIVNAPEVKELYQISPKYSVSLNFEDISYYEYSENPDGSEVYSNIADILNTESTGGGVIWDDMGAVWDGVGLTWELGTGGGTTTIVNSGTSVAYPVWMVGAGAVNPTIENYTTGRTLSYEGTVASGQELVVDMMAQTASLSGLSVVNAISGDWIYLEPGENRLGYNTGGDDSRSTIEWNGVVG